LLILNHKFQSCIPILGPSLHEVVFSDLTSLHDAFPSEDPSREAPLARDMSVANNKIRGIAPRRLVSGELPNGTRAMIDMQKNWDIANYVPGYRRGRRDATQ
jgi:hypothetical protein